MALTRRTFLRRALAAAVLAAAPPRRDAAAAAEPLATLIEIDKCVGCGACVAACREANAAKFPEPQKPFPNMVPARVPVADWSERREVDDRLTPYNWLFIQHARVVRDGREIELTLPRRCMHCVNPPCVKLCPWGAAKQLPNGVARIDPEICLGGSKCKSVCPWDIPQRQTGVGLYLKLAPTFAGNGVMYKCDRCWERLAAGGLPACIEACPEGVQSIGPREAILARARAIAAETGGYLYGATENGGTNTIYLSPVPFEELNRAIAAGEGRPHLAPVPDTMAEANRLAAALAIAPLAGIAGAALKLAAQAGGRPSREETDAH